MRIGTQLVLGEEETQRWDRTAVCERIRSIHRTVALDRLLVWNKLDESWMDAVTNVCHSLSIDLYAWQPVLADPLHAAFEEDDLILTAASQRGYGRHGIWDALTRDNDLGEDFLFACANRESVRKKCIEDLEATLSRADVDGVFLDRIRYPSPANGIETLASCACPDCAREFTERFAGPYTFPWEGDDSWVKSAVDLIREAGASLSFEEAVERLGLRDLAEVRQETVTRQVAEVSEAARRSGKKVGLDLFTPSIAALVGQSYRRLAEHGDWIKPMSYCKALGAAGISLEMATLATGIQSILREHGAKIEEAEVMAFLRRVFDLDLPDSVDTLYREGVPERTVEREYRDAVEAVGGTDTEIWPGIELVNNPAFSTAISTAQCREYVKAMRNAGADWIACWNLLYIPGEYFECIAESLH